MVETVKEVLFKEKYETTSQREHSIEVIWYAFPKRGYWPGVALVYCLEGIIEAVVKRVFEEICDVISVPANTIETCFIADQAWGHYGWILDKTEEKSNIQSSLPIKLGKKGFVI